MTVAHAVIGNGNIRVTAYDNNRFEIDSIQRAKDDDLATLSFTAEGSEFCPYKPLALGDSATVNIRDQIQMLGYPERAGADRLVMQLPSGQVTNIEAPPLPEGYAISYDMTTVGGMSGAPVINDIGKVIGVHGLTDSELVSFGRSQQSNLSEGHENEIEAAEERIQGLSRINHFKWGIPIRVFQEKRDIFVAVEMVVASPSIQPPEPDSSEITVTESNTTEIEPEETSVNKVEATLLLETEIEKNRSLPTILSEEQREKLISELVPFDEVLETNSVFSWLKRGRTLYDLGRYEDAIASYDEALALDKDDYPPERRGPLEWVLRHKGRALHQLGRYEEALISFDKSLALYAENLWTWNERGMTLHSVERYQDAIDSFNQAAKYPDEDVSHLVNKGDSLIMLQRYEEALEAYEEAIREDSEYPQAWRNRGLLLEFLGRDEAALASYEEAISQDPEIEGAVSYRDRLKSKLNISQ